MSESKGSIIVVEDEPLISMMIEDMAEDLGWTVEGTANTEALALGSLETQRPTLAMLDIQLQQTTSLRVAEVCRRLGIPMVFTTGYTVSGVRLRRRAGTRKAVLVRRILHCAAEGIGCEAG